MRERHPDRFLCGINPGESEYTINGVRYVVCSRFRNWKDQTETSLPQRFERIIAGNIVPLYVEDADATITAEYACSTAGEEDN